MMWPRPALSNGNAVGRVLHLRLRSAQHGFAPAPVQHNRAAVQVRGCEKPDVQCALS